METGMTEYVVLLMGDAVEVRRCVSADERAT